MQCSHLGCPLLLLYEVLVENRHRRCSNACAGRALLNVQKKFPAPYPHIWGYLPGLSFPRGLAHHFHSVPRHELCLGTVCPSPLLPIWGAGVIISCLSASFDSAPHQHSFLQMVGICRLFSPQHVERAVSFVEDISWEHTTI